MLSALGLVASDERRDHVESFVRPLAEAAELPETGDASLRYRGQSFELSVPLGQDLEERFHRLHEERYGYADRARVVELVSVRTADVVPGPPIELACAARRSATGPEPVALDGATCWVPDGWAGATDSHGTLVLERR